MLTHLLAARIFALWTTEAGKELKTVPQTSCGLRIGRFFGRVIHREGRGVESLQGEIDINRATFDPNANGEA
jgi:hypothetical protein